MPHLQREKEDLLKQADRITSAYEESEDEVVTQRRRSRRSAHDESVVLSSKFVVGRLRNRYEAASAEPEAETYWLEFPRSNAEALEKRGVEVVVHTDDEPLDKKFVVKGGLKPKQANGKGAKRRLKTQGTTEKRGPYYHLSAIDLQWLEIHTFLSSDCEHIDTMQADDLEHTLNALENKKNETILKRMKKQITNVYKTPEGTPQRFEREFGALQRFIELTRETIAVLNYETIGESIGLSKRISLDVWEYWKCKLQNDYFQPLIPPPASEFDYRRISLIAAWNMTVTPFAQRIRHDAERIRLMYDLLQKRNLILIKNLAKEEEISEELAELALSSDSKHLSPEDIGGILNLTSSLAAFSEDTPSEGKSDEPVINVLRQWIKDMGQSQQETASVETDNSAVSPPRLFVTETQTGIQPIAISSKLIGWIPKHHSESPKHQMSPHANKKTLQKETRSAVVLRPTRARLEHTFEHTDNSCCENGPEDETLLLDSPSTNGHFRMETIKDDDTDLDSSEPLYMLNEFDESGIVLQESNMLSKSSELRSRLRTRKRVS